LTFADLPQIEGPTGRFMLQQMASVAELEAGLISSREAIRRLRPAKVPTRFEPIGTKGLQILKELVPTIERISIISNPDNPGDMIE